MSDNNKSWYRRYRIPGVKDHFYSLTEVKQYIITHKDDFRGITQPYKVVDVYCGTVKKCTYKYVQELKKVVRV